MAEESPETKTESAPPTKTVTIKRVQIGLNVIIQVAVVIFIVGMVNYFSFHHFKRFDQTRDQKYVLSGQTKQLLGGLKKPVKAVVFFSTIAVYGPTSEPADEQSPPRPIGLYARAKLERRPWIVLIRRLKKDVREDRPHSSM